MDGNSLRLSFIINIFFYFFIEGFSGEFNFFKNIQIIVNWKVNERSGHCLLIIAYPIYQIAI